MSRRRRRQPRAQCQPIPVCRTRTSQTNNPSTVSTSLPCTPRAPTGACRQVPYGNAEGEVHEVGQAGVAAAQGPGVAVGRIGEVDAKRRLDSLDGNLGRRGRVRAERSGLQRSGELLADGVRRRGLHGWQLGLLATPQSLCPGAAAARPFSAAGGQAGGWAAKEARGPPKRTRAVGSFSRRLF